MAVSFADLDEDLSLVPIKNTRPERCAQNCPTCLGRGKVVYGYINIKEYPCRICKGTGKVTHERLNRVAGARRAHQTKAQNLAKAIEAFKIDHASEYKWLCEGADRNNSFATSLLDALTTYGRLSERQLAAVTKNVVERAERHAAFTSQQIAEAPVVEDGAGKLHQAFKMAAFFGNKRLKIRAFGLVFMPAKAEGVNAGAIYAKTKSGIYLGKILESGSFIASRDCTADLKDAVLQVAADPLTAAINYGKLTGECACCGKHLTDEKSVELGIGPICLTKWFGKQI